MNLEIITFILYLIIAASTTIIVGQSLYKNGAVFLERIFRSTPHIVKPLNKMLLVGFYLMNLGFVLAFFTQKTSAIYSIGGCVEFLSTKLGIVYLLLGVMHLFNLFLFVTIEKRLNKETVSLENI